MDNLLFNVSQQKLDKKLPKIDSSASLKQEENLVQLQNIKGNVKNAYIKKINSLLNVVQHADEENDHQKIKKKISSNNMMDQARSSSGSDNYDNIGGEQRENEGVRMLKNRESARNSRQRKKIYISLLERKVEDLTGQIETLRQQTEISFKHIHGIIDQNPNLRGMVIEQSQVHDQIREKISNDSQIEPERDEQLQLLVDSYKLRFSASGQKRRQYMKYCFQNLAKQLLEGNYGPLLFGQSGMTKNYQMTENEEFNSYIQQLKEVTGIQDENQTYKAVDVVRRMIDHKKNQKFLMKQLRKQLKELRSRQQVLEDIMDDVVGTFSPSQFAQFLTQVSNIPNEKIQLKEEYVQPEFHKLKPETVQQQLTYSQQLLNFPLEFLLGQKFQHQQMMNPILFDPITFNDMLQKKQFPTK